jgi:hypothetical protein
MVGVLKTIPKCNHQLEIPCHQDPSTFACTKPCPKKLPCGHQCSHNCGQRCAKKCVKEVQKTWPPCGHTCKTECHVDPTATACPNPCDSSLKCEHPCEGRTQTIINNLY